MESNGDNRILARDEEEIPNDPMHRLSDLIIRMGDKLESEYHPRPGTIIDRFRLAIGGGSLLTNDTRHQEKSNLIEDDGDKSPALVSSDSGVDLRNVADETPDDSVTKEEIEMIKNQTEEVVCAFMQEHGRGHLQHKGQSGTNQTDGGAVNQSSNEVEFVETLSTLVVSDQTSQNVSRLLERMGGDVEAKFRPQIQQLVNDWFSYLTENGAKPLTFNLIWPEFKLVVKKVLATGVSWYKLLVLFSFAYEVAVILYRDKVPACVRLFIKYFIDYLMEIGAIAWIARNGGWATALTALRYDMVTSQMKKWAPFLFCCTGITALAFGIFLYAKRK